MIKKANHNVPNCYWGHSQEDDCWFTSCDMAYFISGPAWHNCPNCGGFIVIDYYGKHVSIKTKTSKQKEEHNEKMS